MTNDFNKYYSFERHEVAKEVPLSIKTILDIGCGRGNFLKLIKTQIGAETWGLEKVSGLLENSGNHIDHVLIGRVEDIIGTVPDTYFDCITLNDLLEHLLEPNLLLNQIKSKLSREGIIIASIPNFLFFDNLYELIIKNDWEYKDAGILDKTHLRFFTKKSAIRMFKEAGYIISKYRGINPKKTWKYRLFTFLTFGFFKETKYLQFVFIARAI